MGWLVWIFKALGNLLAPLFEIFLAQGRKPREVLPTGFSDDLKKDMDESVKKQAMQEIKNLVMVKCPKCGHEFADTSGVPLDDIVCPVCTTKDLQA